MPEQDVHRPPPPPDGERPERVDHLARVDADEAGVPGHRAAGRPGCPGRARRRRRAARWAPGRAPTVRTGRSGRRDSPPARRRRRPGARARCCRPPPRRRPRRSPPARPGRCGRPGRCRRPPATRAVSARSSGPPVTTTRCPASVSAPTIRRGQLGRAGPARTRPTRGAAPRSPGRRGRPDAAARRPGGAASRPVRRRRAADSRRRRPGTAPVRARDADRHPVPDVQQRARIVVADRRDPADPRHPQQQRQRQRGLVERGEHHRLVRADRAQPRGQAPHGLRVDRPRRGVDPRQRMLDDLVDAGQQVGGGPAARPAQQHHPLRSGRDGADRRPGDQHVTRGIRADHERRPYRFGGRSRGLHGLLAAQDLRHRRRQIGGHRTRRRRPPPAG